MGSLEVYDHKKKAWVPYLPDPKKWEDHFRDLAEGRVRPDHKGRYIVGSGARWRSESPTVELVTPVAQTLEMARSDKKVIRGMTPKRRKTVRRTKSVNQLD